MSVFVYAEHTDGVYKKSAFEAVAYAKSLAQTTGDTVTAVAINPTDASERLYTYGADKVIKVKAEGLVFNPSAYAQILSEQMQGSLLIFPHTTEASSVAAMLSVMKGFSLITNVVALPEGLSPVQVKKKVFSGKGYSIVKADASGVVLSLYPNAFGAQETPVSGTEEEVMTNVSSQGITVISHEAASGKVNLKDAEIVVSAGRGLKSPEHWPMIEDLAETLGAAVACSKPVSDMGWRPHSEHVGQTGKTIAPNLYIAVGISGAIQHLAGVNASKTIVVINSDPEAPFFKSADYGVVGDAFQIIPALTEKIKAAKG